MATIDQIRRVVNGPALRALALAVVVGLPLFAPTAHAQVCPFDDGNSSLEVEGLILTRYALGVTGAPLVASTGINAVDAPSVEAAINCPSCGLNITGNPTMTVADATIISRKLAGFAGAVLTDGLSLGSGTRNTPAAVQSFLLAGCGATGGTVTSISAGTGLTGGTITGSGSIAADTTYLQRRVSSNCAVGSFLTAIAADGSITCTTPAAGGTVTSVAMGAGLSGPTITNTGTVALASTFKLPQGCSTGQVPKFNSGTGLWECQTDIVGTGTVTAVSATAPLASSGGTAPTISLSGIIPVASGGTGSGSLTSNGVVIGQGGGAVVTAVGGPGQVLVGAAGPPVWTASPSLAGNITVAGDGSVGGALGVGTVAPASGLDVRGDVKLGPTGQFFAPGGQENLRILRGTIGGGANGTPAFIFAGTGFTVARVVGQPVGDYFITFTTPFSNIPSPVVTPNTTNQSGTAIVSSIGSTGFRAQLLSNGAPSDQNWTFIVVGPR